MTAPETIWYDGHSLGRHVRHVAPYSDSHPPHQYTRTDTIPDPMQDPRVKALVEASKKVIAAAELREAYHRLPNDKNRIGDPKSAKVKARDAWLKAFRRATTATFAALSTITKETPMNVDALRKLESAVEAGE